MPARAKKPARSLVLPDTCSKSELAVLLGVSERSVDTWVQRGVVVRAERGRYQPAPSLKAYCRVLLDRAAATPGANATLAEERLGTQKAVRQIKELELAKLQSETLSAVEIGAAWTSLATLVRQAIEVLPSRAGAAVSTLTPHDVNAIGNMCRDILQDLAAEADGLVGANPKELLNARI